MWTVSRRPMTGEERRELQKARGFYSRRRVHLLRALAVALFLGSGAEIALGVTPAHRMRSPVSVGLIGAAMVAGGLSGLWWSRRKFPADLEAVELIHRDLWGDEVELVNVTASEAIRMRGSSAVPSGYFLDVGAGEVLFVEQDPPPRPTDAGPDPEPKGFPCRRFQMIRAPHSGLELGLECLGEKLPTSGEIDPLEGEPYVDCLVDGLIFHGRLRRLREDLEVYARQAKAPLGSVDVCGG